MTTGRTCGGVALLLSALVATLPPRLDAVQTSAIDPAALAAFAWQPIGPERSDITAVTTDAGFPYRVCARETGGRTRCVPARTEDTAIRTWQLLAVSGDGALYPDPADAEVVYTARLRRFDRRTGQATWVGPALADQFRAQPSPEAALAFSADGRNLFAGFRQVWRTANGGLSWTAISPDLVASVEQGRISHLDVSPIDARVIWAGTTTGRLHQSRDGGVTWTAASLPVLEPGGRLVGLISSRFDPLSAYLTTDSPAGAALWRTRNNGASWTMISRTLPPAAGVRGVREDVQRRGLLFTATDASVFVSIDDGESWLSLRNNLPPVAVSDVAIRDADLVIGTRGAGAWVLDDFSALRQITADVLRSEAFLFRPAPAVRARATASSGPDSQDLAHAWDGNGAAIVYLVGRALAGPITIELIETATGDVIRRFSSDPMLRQPGDGLLSIERGLQRVVWDLRYARPEGDAGAPPGARVVPGTYQVRLTAPAHSIRQSVAVRMDPRVRAAPADLVAQRVLARALDAGRARVTRAIERLGALDVTAGEKSDQPNRHAALRSSLDELRRFARALDEADGRPSIALEAAAAAALERAAGTAPLE
jgi:hypothetical protein